MITVEDFYKVMCAMVPLYFAMLVAYSSVKWWKIFTAEQCAGINRFVAVFAVPILSFHFISQNNPFEMDTKFILADTISKVFVLLLLSVWAVFFSGGRLDWVITLFSLATLPNTLVMGIPLLNAMYGDFTQPLMVQLVVLQCIVWYTLLLFLFEYRAATLLIQNQFPGSTAAAIAKIEVDADIISLDGRDKLLTETDIDTRGQIRVRICRSTSSAPSSGLSSIGITPRASNLSNVEIFSINTPTQPHGPHRSTDVSFDLGSGYGSSDAYSLQPTPRASNFNEMDMAGNTPMWGRSPVGGRIFRQGSPVVKMAWESPENGVEGQGYKAELPEKEISFRDSSITAMGEEVEAKRSQEMPKAFVMIKLILTVVTRKLSRNPNTYSSALALLWSLVSFKWKVEMPSLVKESIKIISDAGLGMAMFSLGLFMGLQPKMIGCGGKRAALGMGIRFLFGPIAMSAASLAVGLRGVRLHTAIVQAALPQGIVPFVFAREYGLHPDILSTGVIFGMLVSLPITLIYYILLGL
ncbi:auxin efflux carrier component 6 [Benincasa hispida]|uniref:auxin efflux carrier component 6 n=1 Tax=Benincasa hispida TaxID=102211 RepID=UPI001902B04C|nr:auxin efflux carrier component 6 [Benincasa hispida]